HEGRGSETRGVGYWCCCGELQVVQLTKFHYRLANHLGGEIPKLHCRTTTWTGTFMKMRSMAKRYIAVHLRVLKDEDK
ncbi:hypothetical protein Tsubulata_024281, partial [Turnera subulata]